VLLVKREAAPQGGGAGAEQGGGRWGRRARQQGGVGGGGEGGRRLRLPWLLLLRLPARGRGPGPEPAGGEEAEELGLGGRAGRLPAGWRQPKVSVHVKLKLVLPCKALPAPVAPEGPLAGVGPGGKGLRFLFRGPWQL
jgi:hypothetical protein